MTDEKQHPPLRTIEVVPVRAGDLPEGATVRYGTGTWHHLYENAQGGDVGNYGNEEVDTITSKDLDERYVVLRLSREPEVTLTTAKPREEETSRKVALVRGSQNKIEVGVYDDILQVARFTDLWQMQVVVERPWGGQH